MCDSNQQPKLLQWLPNKTLELVRLQRLLAAQTGPRPRTRVKESPTKSTSEPGQARQCFGQLTTTKLTNIRYMVFPVNSFCLSALPPTPLPHPPSRNDPYRLLGPINCYFRVFRRLSKPQLATFCRRRSRTIFNLSANQIENCQNC